MGFRTLEIRRPAELHVTMGQLTIEQEEGKVMIPLEDLTTIVCIGSNIRLSTLGMAQMARCGITVLMIDTTYKPAAVLLPVESNARQALVMQKQISLSAVCKSELWQRIIRKKIENQARTLSILGLPGAEEVLNYVADLSEDNIDYTEALAAKRYFSYYHPGLNRRNDDSINSRLNYGYGNTIRRKWSIVLQRQLERPSAGHLRYALLRKRGKKKHDTWGDPPPCVIQLLVSLSLTTLTKYIPCYILYITRCVSRRKRA